MPGATVVKLPAQGWTWTWTIYIDLDLIFSNLDPRNSFWITSIQKLSRVWTGNVATPAKKTLVSVIISPLKFCKIGEIKSCKRDVFNFYLLSSQHNNMPAIPLAPFFQHFLFSTGTRLNVTFVKIWSKIASLPPDSKTNHRVSKIIGTDSVGSKSEIVHDLKIDRAIIGRGEYQKISNYLKILNMRHRKSQFRFGWDC